MPWHVSRSHDDYQKQYYDRPYKRRCPRCWIVHWTYNRDGLCETCNLDAYYEEEHYG